MAKSVRQAPSDPDQLHPGQKPWLGRTVQIVGLTAVVVVIMVIAVFAEGLHQNIRKLLGFVVFFSGILIARHIYKSGKRHLVSSGAAAMAADPRPPILYLRSFVSDDKISGEEEVLANIVGELGPVVAIGKPDDPLPPLGASRFYVAGDNWQAFVADLMDQSALVLLLAGDTPGLSWEISQCRRALAPGKLVILVPDNPELYEFFRREITANSDILMPDFPDRGLTRHKAGQICGLIRFDPEWRGQFVPFVMARFAGQNLGFPTAYSRMAPRFRLALDPICRQVGLHLKEADINVPHFLALVFLAAMIILPVVWIFVFEVF